MLSISRFLHKNQAVLVSRQLQRTLSSQTDGETRIAHILKEKFPSATSLKVVDISGGCGAMYEVHIESNEFKGKRTVQQHQLVNQALKEEIQGMHGLRIFTDIPSRVGPSPFTNCRPMNVHPSNGMSYADSIFI